MEPEEQPSAQPPQKRVTGQAPRRLSSSSYDENRDDPLDVAAAVLADPDAGNIAGAAWDAAKGLTRLTGRAMEGLAGAASNLATNAVDAVPVAGQAALDAAGSVASAAADMAGTAMDVAGGAAGAAAGVAGAAGEAAGATLKLAGAAAGAAGDVAGNIDLGAIADAAGNVADIIGPVVEVAGDILGALDP